MSSFILCSRCSFNARVTEMENLSTLGKGPCPNSPSVHGNHFKSTPTSVNQLKKKLFIEMIKYGFHSVRHLKPATAVWRGFRCPLTCPDQGERYTSMAAFYSAVGHGPKGQCWHRFGFKAWARWAIKRRAAGGYWQNVQRETRRRRGAMFGPGQSKPGWKVHDALSPGGSFRITSNSVSSV